MALIDDIKVKFPNIDMTLIDTYLPIYEDTYQCYYGVEYGNNKCDDTIILYLLAHLITTADATSNGQAIDPQIGSYSVEDVSTSYAVNALDSKDNRGLFFGSSVYGQQFLLLTQNKGLEVYWV